MFTAEQLRKLASFQSLRFPLSTFYWKTPVATDRAHHDDHILIQNLLREGRRQLESGNHEREWTRSAEADQEKISQYFNSHPEARRSPMALFCCSGESFWQAVRLPRMLRSGFIVGETFYLQPLTVLLDQYHRYCTVLVDRQSARIFEIYMGESEEHAAFLDDVPGRIKAATWTGGNERQIERRTENKAHQHYKRTAEVVLQFFRKHHFDWLILGGHPEGLAVFEGHLHSYLRARLIGSFHADPKAASWQPILAKSMEIADVRDRQEKAQLIEEVFNKASHGRLGVVGLAETLRALELGEVHTLVLDQDFQASASICRNCGGAAAEGPQVCNRCGELLQRLENAAEHVVEQAIQDGSQVRFVNSNDRLMQAGNIGALLRFRAPESE